MSMLRLSTPFVSIEVHLSSDSWSSISQHSTINDQLSLITNHCSLITNHFLRSPPSSPQTDSLPACVRGLTYSLPLLSASRLNPSMSLASLRLHSPCPVAAATRTGRGEANFFLLPSYFSPFLLSSALHAHGRYSQSDRQNLGCLLGRRNCQPSRSHRADHLSVIHTPARR